MQLNLCYEKENMARLYSKKIRESSSSIMMKMEDAQSVQENLYTRLTENSFVKKLNYKNPFSKI